MNNTCCFLVAFNIIREKTDWDLEPKTHFLTTFHVTDSLCPRHFAEAQKKKRKRKNEKRDEIRRIAWLYFKADGEKRERGPVFIFVWCWLARIDSVCFPSSLSVAGRKRQREMWEGYMIRDPIPRVVWRDIQFKRCIKHFITSHLHDYRRDDWLPTSSFG